MRFKYYCSLYAKLFIFTLQSALSYRLNFFIQLFYGPLYMGVLYLLLMMAYSQKAVIAGWTKEEGILIFCVVWTIYLLGMVLFIKGIRHFLWAGLRNGEADFYLIKPANFQFLCNFSLPDLNQLPAVIFIGGMLIRQMIILHSQITWTSLLTFLGLFPLAMLIMYFTFSIYQTLGFFIVKAAQIIELLDKTADFAQYPPAIFPSAIQFVTFSFIPIAFYGFVPTIFLLNKGSGWMLVLTILLVAALWLINRWAWKFSIKHYSSASS